jgi:hypothetical protein
LAQAASGWQLPALHSAVRQSAGPLHAFGTEQPAQVGPPQSISDSPLELLKKPSVHVGTQPAGSHIALTPGPQAGQSPPQSASVSVPSKKPSTHDQAQASSTHSALAQSPPSSQAVPSGQPTAQALPQSTASSSPFATPSSQLAAKHTPPLQTPLAQ